jgi:hypothetical protein
MNPWYVENRGVSLFETLPELVYDIESALVRLGRGKVADQLREAPLAHWSHDDFAKSTRLELGPAIEPSAVAEVISLDDDIGVCLDLDAAGRIAAIEVTGYEEYLARLGAAPVPGA